MSTTKTIVSGGSITIRVAQMLVMASQWFEVTPLPDDDWWIKVKMENKGLLFDFIDRAHSQEKTDQRSIARVSSLTQDPYED